MKFLKLTESFTKKAIQAEKGTENLRIFGSISSALVAGCNIAGVISLFVKSLAFH